MSITILVMVVAYYAIIMGIGLYVTKWVKSDRDYLLAGREVSAPVVALGSTAILASGAVVASAVVSSYVFGFWYGFMVAFGWGVFFLVFAVLFAPLIRRSGVTSVGEWIAVQYDKKTQVLAAVLMIFFVGVLFNVLQLTAGGQLFSGITGVSYPVVVIVTGLLATAYVWFGGLWGAAITDIYQFIGAAAVFVGLPIILWATVPDVGGLGWLTANVPDGWWGNGMSGIAVTSFGAAALLGSFLWAVFLILGNQFYWVRMASARSEKVAIRGGIAAGVLAPIFLGAPLAIIGGYALVLFPGQSGPGDIWGSLLSIVPAWVVGLVMVALLAAVQSTMNANIIAASANVVRDLVEPSGRATPRTSLRAGRFTVLICGVVSTLVAAVWQADPGTILAFAGALSAALAFPIILNGMLLPARFLSGTSGFVIMLGTFAFVAGWQLLSDFDVHVIWIAIGSGTALTVVALVVERVAGRGRATGSETVGPAEEQVPGRAVSPEVKARILESVRFGRDRMDLLVDSLEDTFGEERLDLATVYAAVDALEAEGLVHRKSRRWVGFTELELTDRGRAGLRELDAGELALAERQLTGVDVAVLGAIRAQGEPLDAIVGRIEGDFRSGQVLAALSHLRRKGYVVDSGALKARYATTGAGADAAAQIAAQAAAIDEVADTEG